MVSEMRQALCVVKFYYVLETRSVAELSRSQWQIFISFVREYVFLYNILRLDATFDLIHVFCVVLSFA